VSLQLNGESAAPVRDAVAEAAASAGARLRDARMAAGLSIDAVAQQLKLAPRQVKALEDNDFAQLPGRTFVRGFMRNYARLVRLDPGTVLAALPEAGTAPSLDHPSLAATTRVMGELPADLHDKPSSARWAIPLALVAIVAIAVVYEFGRPLAERGKAALADRSSAATSAAPGAPTASDTAASGGAAGTAAVVPRSETTAASSAPTADTPLAFVFRGTSWIEVKDAKGAIVLSTIGYPGATHAVGGAAPFEVVLGNAEAVMVTWRGAPFDATPFIKQNVAKFTIK
jgi:cytoskeleton protein RodZ